MQRKSFVRQTRSQTRAAQQNTNLNLQIESEQEADDAFEPSVVETAHGDEFDCLGCERPNKAEKYMVQCKLCAKWYHFSCANVTTATVHAVEFTCMLCVDRISVPRTSSVTGKSTSSTTRRAHLALRLQQLEEEKKLQDELHREQLALKETRIKKLQQDKEYITQKFDLMQQQEEDDSALSIQSRRSNRCESSANRVEDWVERQVQTTSAANVVVQTSEHVPPVLSSTSSPVDELEAKRTSTPLGRRNVGDKAAEVDLPAVGTATNMRQNMILPALPLVNIQQFASLLTEPTSGIDRTVGTIPKTQKTQTLFKRWSRATEERRKHQDPQLQEEGDERRSRELELVNRLKQLERLRLSELAERDAEIIQLRKVGQEFQQKLSMYTQQDHRPPVLRQDISKNEERQRSFSPQDAAVSFMNVPAQRSSCSILPSNQPARETSNQVGANRQTNLGNDSSHYEEPLVVPSRHSISMDSINNSHAYRNAYTPSLFPPPFGDYSSHTCPTSLDGQSQCSIQPPLSWGSSVAQNIVPSVHIRPTSHQLAARHVVAKDLPVFTGDPVDWPLFISCYRHSSDTCGFSDAENLLRLQRCLRGSAKDAVSSFLLHPSMVPQVLSTLQTLYGRPEQIVQHLVAKVRSTPPPKSERFETLVSFGLVVQNLSGHLKAVGLQTHLSNPTLLQELVDKLPATVKFDWALYQQQQPVVDLNTFSDYMAKVVSATSAVTALGTVPQKAVREERVKTKEKVYVNTHTEMVGTSKQESTRADDWCDRRKHNTDTSNAAGEAPKPCLVCKITGHQTQHCTTFKRLCIDDRWKIVKEQKLCRRCLMPHTRWPCRGEVCGTHGCQKRHHRLLHSDQPRASTLEQPKQDFPNTNATVTMHRQTMSPATLFRVLPVTLYGAKGQVNTYAFLDDGSSVTLVEREIADLLGVEGVSESLCIHWTGGINKKLPDSRRVELEISGLDSTKRFRASSVYTVNNLGLPEQSIDFNAMANEFCHLRKLPVKSFTSAIPRILIGLNNIHLLTTLKLREGRSHEPIATKTRLGWAVYGNLREDNATLQHRQMFVCTQAMDRELHDYVRDFFSLENVGVTAASVVEGLEDKRARDILETTTKRTTGGRFESGLLWKHDYIEFPYSRGMAEKRLKSLEKRLSKSPDIYNNIRQQVAEFQVKGYAHKATIEELSKFEPRRTWYLPLGVVINPKKPGRVRLIWDAAAKVEGVSLNTMLLKGPDLLTPLMSVLFQYRERQVAISADIKEMFHQIRIRGEDRSAQLFLWRNSPDEPIDTMVTDVAIFGASCSPTHSQFVKNLNASEFEQQHPKAATAIKEKHYVDDYLDSVDTVGEAVQMALDVAKVHEKAGFVIRNWTSNNAEVLHKIGEVNPATVKDFTVDKESGCERLLGMIWLPARDIFSYSVKLRENVQKLILGEVVPTKREMLRVVMSIYDPLGLVAAFVIHGKVLVQDVWRSKIGWDDRIPLDIFTRWKLWLEVLRKLDNVQVSRCYFPGYDPASYERLELHVFVDASEQGYSAVAYFRIVDRGIARCALVAAKTKVAPLQPLTIPKMELMAAVIGVRLRKTIEDKHSLKICRTWFWSDSTTVISWIESDARRYRQFVAFRVSEILSLSSVEEWRWIPTQLNVADEATKWGKGPSFVADCRWFRGPEFLYDEEQEWPKDCRHLNKETEEELRPAFLCRHAVVIPLLDVNRFSKWERILRCVAYVQRFTDNLKRRINKLPPEKGDLTKEELLMAERILWKTAQFDAYPAEVNILMHNCHNTKQVCLEKQSPLARLPPTIDEFGVLRVEGRTQKADHLAHDTKFPIILPREHRVTELLVDYYHRRFRHANNETVVNELKQRFHISHMRSMVKRMKKNCMWCRVFKSVPVVPKMGSLPRVRLTPFLRPFTFVGIDYFGPYLVKVGRSSVKRWVALFTCLTVRAVHLEVAANLSTDSCKKAIRRFVARRGPPQVVYTDNGTNFVGASRELEAEKRSINTELSSTFTDTHTEWRFSPPAAPHMGGCWERMVRSVKTALGVIPAEGRLDEESFATLLLEAEHMVNSRPLTFVPIETEADEALTPNHFLLLSSDGVRQPVKDSVDEKASFRSSWNRIQFILGRFWRRWLNEYLPTITRRTKWFRDVRPVKVGELVVIANENIRNRWLRGRVVRTYPGKDGTVRQADVRTINGVVRRPVAKLAVLDVGIEDDAEEKLLATPGGGCSEHEVDGSLGVTMNQLF